MNGGSGWNKAAGKTSAGLTPLGVLLNKKLAVFKSDFVTVLLSVHVTVVPFWWS